MAIIQDLVFVQRLRKHVVKELTSIGGFPKGNHIVILCPFHADTNPSLGVNIGDDLLPGIFHCYSCFPLNAPILTPFGLENIGNLRVGDEVISAEGVPRRILNIFDREHTGEMCSFKMDKRDDELVCTPEHKIFSLKADQVTYGRAAAGTIKVCGEINAVEAQQLQPGDWVCAPSLNFQTESITIHNAGGIYSNSPGTGKMPELPSEIDVDGEVACFNHSGKVFYRIKEKNRIPVNALPVRDLEVEIDHSYNAYGISVHNCGASGSWNKLADSLNLVPYEREKLSEIKEKDNIFRLMSKTLLTMKDKLEETPDTLQGTEDIPPGYTWRNYDKAFLDHFKAKLWWDRNRDLNYLYFPLTMNSQYVGYTLCNLNRDRSSIKYLLFTDAKKTFFLYDYIPSQCPIVLVEGHTDALRLFRSGIPALALFGVENWGALKKSFLMAKMPKKVWIMMDGDEPGHRAAQKIFMDLRGGCDVDLITLPIQNPKMDPDSIPQEWVEEIKSKIDL